ncbi:MAG: hypothetical protein GY795_23885 [Desulfobacterales bacterium]|nr:hypothetical protein [Desulfobacterales bacterium]
MKKTVCILVLFFCLAVSGENICSAQSEKIRIHGFISQGYLKSDRNNFIAETEDGTFQFNESGINFSADLSEKLRLGIQFFSRDIGNLSNNEVTIDWAFADYHWHDWLGFRAGKIKNPVGFYNETRDVDMLRTNILLPQSVYHEMYRDDIIALQGLGLYGSTSVGFMGTLSYQAQYGTMNVDAESGSSKEVEQAGPFDVTGFDVDYAYAASLKWDTFIQGLQLGGCLATAEIDLGIKKTNPLVPLPSVMTFKLTDYTIKILSAEYTWDNLIISSEYKLLSTERHLESNSVIISPEVKIDSEGYYFSASYRFTDWFELGAYYSVYYPDKDDKKGEKTAPDPDHSAWSEDSALSLRFDINENWIFKLEGHYIDGTSLLMNADNPDGLDKNWFMFAAKTTFHF